MGDSNKQFDADLISEYYTLVRIRRKAVAENAKETVALIDEEITVLKSKIQSLELPDIPLE
ncbi:MAG: hypothetical protein IJ801_07000 [Lachnospiraceae bacterium]|nr:hypothetical protein [Lachnospiraceae bacterium]